MSVDIYGLAAWNGVFSTISRSTILEAKLLVGLERIANSSNDKRTWTRRNEHTNCAERSEKRHTQIGDGTCTNRTRKKIEIFLLLPRASSFTSFSSCWECVFFFLLFFFFSSLGSIVSFVVSGCSRLSSCYTLFFSSLNSLYAVFISLSDLLVIQYINTIYSRTLQSVKMRVADTCECCRYVRMCRLQAHTLNWVHIAIHIFLFNTCFIFYPFCTRIKRESQAHTNEPRTTEMANERLV